MSIKFGKTLSFKEICNKSNDVILDYISTILKKSIPLKPSGPALLLVLILKTACLISFSSGILERYSLSSLLIIVGIQFRIELHLVRCLRLEKFL